MWTMQYKLRVEKWRSVVATSVEKQSIKKQSIQVFVYEHKRTTVVGRVQRVQLFFYTCILSSSSMMSLMLGRSADLSLVQLLMRDIMAGHWIRWIWSFLCSGWDSGSLRRHISTSTTPKLKTSIFGECWWGKLASGAAYAGLPGPAVVTSFMKLADP